VNRTEEKREEKETESRIHSYQKASTGLPNQHVSIKVKGGFPRGRGRWRRKMGTCGREEDYDTSNNYDYHYSA
jgi:hypothetical protein